MHHQFRLSLLQWNPGPARRNPTNIVCRSLWKDPCGCSSGSRCSCGSVHLRKPMIMFRTSPISNTDIAILLNKDTFEPQPIVLTFKVDSTSKGTWCMVLLIVRGLLRRPSLSLVHRLLLFAQYTLIMSWLRNVMHLLSSFSAFMDICKNTTSTSLVVTST